jgi:hypothetical protein
VSDAAVVLVDVGAVVLVLVELVLVELVLVVLVLVVLVLVVLVLVVDADASAGRADSPPDVAEVASEDVGGGGTIAGAAVLVAESDRAPIPSGEPDGPPLQPAQVASAATSTIADGRTSRT